MKIKFNHISTININFKFFPILKQINNFASKRSSVLTSLRFYAYLFTFHFSLLTFNYGQVLNEDLNHPIYPFIEKLALQKIIDINYSVKPFTKEQIAKWLKEGKRQKAKLNSIEGEELEWFLEEYDLERDSSVSKLGMLNYNGDSYKFRAVPIIGYEMSATGSNAGHSRWVGAHIEGASDKLSLMLEYLDTGEFGDNVNSKKVLTPKTGHFIKGAPDGIEFSDVKGNISYDFGYGSLSLKKEYVNIGSGNFGKLILSSKAADFPHIEFKLNPANWLQIYYMHGWLNSLVLDSNNFYYSYASEIEPRLVESYINKYIALNYITLLPYKWLQFSMGNSFIYSGDLRPEMFIPVMYFKVMDHNTGRGDVNDGNGMIFFDFNVSYFKNIDLYSTLLIDVLEIRSVLNGEFYKNWVGFTVGGKLADAGFENLNFSLEYTRLNPWIYENKYETTNYKHLGYVLGHWMGNNSDLLSLQLDYKFIRSLAISSKVEFLRKGGEEDLYYAYKERKSFPFLFGDNRKDMSFNLSAIYNPIHNVFLKGIYSYSEISDKFEGRTPGFLLGSKNSFSLSLSYGLP